MTSHPVPVILDRTFYADINNFTTKGKGDLLSTTISDKPTITDVRNHKTGENGK
jgi:hypothetical protein